MTQINVSQLLKEPLGSIRKHKINDNIDTTSGSQLISGEIQMTRADQSILVKGTLDTEVELTCSRCLNPFSCPLTINIEEEYFPTKDVITGASLSLPEEPGSFTIDGDNILDLTEAISQYTLMVIPMKPLCREDCAGLCPTCGVNLNNESCDCPAKPSDSRWSKLTQFSLNK